MGKPLNLANPLRLLRQPEIVITTLEDFLDRFVLVCQDMDGETDPADKKRIKAMRGIIRELKQEGR